MSTDNTLILTNDNYYSSAANTTYMSVSQFKDFAGTIAHVSCEETALKKFKNEIIPTKTDSLLIGSYVDSYFEGTLDTFKTENPEIFKKTGDKGLRAEFVKADKIIDRRNKDPLFSDFMSGQKQVIMTADLFGIPWKIKMDSYHPDDKIVDLKVMKDMNPIWAPLLGRKTTFINYWGYDIQGAIYQKVVELNTGKRLPFYICCATKEDVPDIDIFEIPQEYLDIAYEFVKDNIEHVLNIKNGVIPAKRCNNCVYCRSTKVLTQPTSLTDLMLMQNLIQSDDSSSGPIGLFDD